MWKRLIALMWTAGLLVAFLPATLYSQSEYSITPTIGIVKLNNYDGADPYSFYSIEYDYSLGLRFGKRMTEATQMELAYRYFSPRQVANFVDRGPEGGFIEGPRFASELKTHAASVGLRHSFLAIGRHHLSILAGGGVIIIDPADNESVAVSVQDMASLEKFDTVVNPIVNIGVGFQLDLGGKFLLLEVEDTLQFCRQSGPQEYERDYLCASDHILNHPEARIGLVFGF